MAAYITPALATVYFATRLYAEKWTASTAAEKLAALTMAQQAVDAQPYVGVRATTTQTDAFPRCYTVRSDRYNGWEGSTLDMDVYTGTTVPQCVKDATCEEALALLRFGDSERIRLQGQGVTSASRGDLHETYSPRNGLISPEARALLRPWMMGVVPLTT
jgi:hypothetical protein